MPIRFGGLSAVAAEAVESGTGAAAGFVEKFGGVSRSGFGAAIVEIVRKLRGFLVQTQKTDRIMAGQNHAEQRRNHCWQDHKKRGA